MYSYPIEELDSGIEKMTPNKDLMLWHTAIQYINLQQILRLLKHVSLKFPAFLDDSLSKQVALSSYYFYLLLND